MKKSFRYIFAAVGLVMVMFFCVSATSAITNGQTLMTNSFSEPLRMLLLGFGLIGFGTFVKSRFYR